MPGQPSPGSLATYTFDFTTLALAEIGVGGVPLLNIVPVTSPSEATGTLVYAGAAPGARVALLAAAGGTISVTVVFDQIGAALEGILGAPAIIPIAAGILTYTFTIPIAAGTLPIGIFDVKAVAVVSTPAGGPTEDAGYNEVPIVQIIP